MAWKTGRGRTLEVKGTIAATAYEGLLYPDSGQSYRHESQVAISLSALGVSLSIHQDQHNDGRPYYEFGISGAAGSASQSVPFTLGGPLDLGGDYTIEVPVEEWVDIGVLPRGQSDIDAGIVDAPQRLSLRFYEMTVPGGTATAKLNSGGVSLSSTATLSAGSVSYAGTINATAFLLRENTGDDTASDSSTCHVTMSFAGTEVAGTGHGSGQGCSVSNADGAKIDLVAPLAITQGVKGGCATTLAPAKSFNLVSGIIDSLGDPYPGEVDLDCSRFAGDPSPILSAGSSFGTSGSQQENSFGLYLGETYGYDYPIADFYNDSGGENQWQPLSISVDSAWCRAHDEYVTYQVEDDAGNVATRFVDDDAVHLHGWSLPGLALSQALSVVIDPCTSASGWTGAAASGGGLQNTGAAMTVTFPALKNFSGYRYLRVRAQAPSPQSFRVVLGGKQWTKDYRGRALSATTTAADFDIDLCDPTNDASAYDVTDTRWPRADVSGDGYAPAVDGPLWGVGYASALTVDSLGAAGSVTLLGISQVRHTRVRAHILPTHAPRFDGDMIEFAPSVTNDSGTVTSFHCRRFLLANTDGRQSFEWADLEVSKVEGENATYYVPHYASIANLSLNASADTGLTGQFPGWTGVACGVAADGSGNIHGDYLSGDSPAVWLMGGGLLFTGGGSGYGYAGAASGWTSGVGMDASGTLSLGAQMLFSEVDWYPGIGDIFGFAPSWAEDADTTLYLVAHKIFRGQAHGLLLREVHGAVGGQAVTLSRQVPALPATTPPTTTLETDGAATTDTATAPLLPEGMYRTTGAGVPGYSHSQDAATPPNTFTANIQAALKWVRGSDTRTAAATFFTRHLSRIALRVPLLPPGRRAAITVDSARQWLHVGRTQAIETYHAGGSPSLLAFTSPDYPVDAWRRLRADPRKGDLLMLAQAGTDHVLYQSRDGGNSGVEVHRVTTNNGLIERLSERGQALFLYEDNDTNHNVFYQQSPDGGSTWNALSPVMYAGAQLQASLLDLSHDPRRSALNLLCTQGADTIVLESQDAGEKWSLKLG